MLSTSIRLLNTPPLAVVSARVKEEPGASLKMKPIVAVLCARLTFVLSVVTETVGVTVSTMKSPVLPPLPGLPLFSVQLPAMTLTTASSV